MDRNAIANYIKELRKEKGMTQSQLADKLYISYQAVSKWENADSLPDTSMLLDLSELLGVSVDMLLNGGKIVMDKKKFMSVDNVIKGFKAFEDVKKYFGESSTFYRGMVEGVDKKMNIDIESYLKDEKTRDVLITEVLLQHIMNGGIINIDEARQTLKNKKMVSILEEYLEKYR